MTPQKQDPIGNSAISAGAAIGALVLAIVFVQTVIASPAAQAQTFNEIHTFTGGQDGASPYAGVTLDKAGNNLYGTTTYGSVGNDGTIYRLKRSGSNWVFNPLYSLNPIGAYPLARVIFGPDGLLYGTAELDGVFNLRPSPTTCRAILCPWAATVVYDFSGADGRLPGYGDLLFDQARNIYGTTGAGGTYSGGVVYELTPSGSESVLYAFAGRPDGASPKNGVIFDSGGNLYGTTFAGGLHGYGTVFQLINMHPGWTEGLLHSFSNGSDGSLPVAGLIFDGSGNLYGATSDGGTGGGGTVFELSPPGDWTTLTVLYSFAGTAGNGCGPWGTLIMKDGNLYGTTYCDGPNNAGSVFKLTPSGPPWSLTTLHDFTGGNDGAYPISNVIFDANGNLYGTASAGGSQTVGVVWEITP